jgi:uncharacterized membrane protein
VSVDVTTDVVVDRPVDAVAAYTCDPRNAPEWYANIRSVEVLDDGPVVPGTRMRFVAAFLGRRLEYTYAVTELVTGERMSMTTSQGPFPMTTEYRFSSVGPGRTLVTLRNHGEPSGFGSVAAPLVRRSMERANRKDLDALKAVLEAHGT